ncbi:MAG: hypothetical protein U9Q83_02605 [Bacteroidota bacterium]|nr:hypothetical protein [Bacteroidota bacterium]
MTKKEKLKQLYLRREILEKIIEGEATTVNRKESDKELKIIIYGLLSDNDFSSLFRIFKENKNRFKNYKNFEDEYTYENIEGLKLKKFKERLEIFINNCI